MKIFMIDQAGITDQAGMFDRAGILDWAGMFDRLLHRPIAGLIRNWLVLVPLLTMMPWAMAVAQQQETPPASASPVAPAMPSPATPPIDSPAPPPPHALLTAPPIQSPPPVVVPAVQLAPAELTGLLGHAVVGADGAELGRVVDLLVDAQGQVRAVVMDVGGFMGVGNRKVAVAWNALRFATSEKGPVISIQISPDRIKSWADYIVGRPVAILGGSGQ